MRANSEIIEEAISAELKKEIQNAIINSKGGM